MTEFQWNYGLRSLQRHGWNNVRFALRKFTVAFSLGYNDNETGNDLTKSKAMLVKQIQLFKEQNWGWGWSLVGGALVLYPQHWVPALAQGKPVWEVPTVSALKEAEGRESQVQSHP